MSTVSPQQWQKEMSNKGLLIDVRTPFEYASEHAEGATALELSSFSADKVKEILASAGEGVSVVGLICQSGSRAKQAHEICEKAGLKTVVIEGGTVAWVKAGLPKVSGKKVMSLERQVRIAAGLLAFSGVALSKMGLSGAEYLSGFVGAGLMFAGITDTCAMGLIIAKMPWNKSGDCGTSCGVS